MSYTSDKADGPTAGRHSFAAVEFIARLVAHIPDKDQVMRRAGTVTCPCGYYTNRTRGARRKAEEAAARPSVDGGGASEDAELPEGGVTIVEVEDLTA